MSKKIIDVSKHNGVINWAKVSAAGIAGAILRVGYGSDKTSQDDSAFKRNADACKKYNIPFGVYLYSYAKSDAQIESEVKHILRLIKGYKLKLPVYIDLEEPGTEKHAKANAKKFIALINKTEYTPGVYASESWFKTYLKDIKTAWRWVAKYGSNNGKAGTKPAVDNIAMWQYTSRGKVAGVPGFVDESILYKDIIKTKSSSKTSAGTATKKNASKSSSTKKSDAKTYTVKKGDTLTEIAKKHKTTVDALAKKNNIKDKNKIYAGQVIKL